MLSQLDLRLGDKLDGLCDLGLLGSQLDVEFLELTLHRDDFHAILLLNFAVFSTGNTGIGRILTLLKCFILFLLRLDLLLERSNLSLQLLFDVLLFSKRLGLDLLLLFLCL